MKILDRYMAGELIYPFLLGIAGFVVIMTTDLVFTFVDMIINKGIPAEAVTRLILFKLPAIMVLTFPVSFLFAAALAINRMFRDNEISAMRTSGISFFRIGMPVLLIAAAVSTAAFFMNEFLVPAANRISDGLIRQIVYRQPLLGVKEKVFFNDSFGRFYYIRKADRTSGSLDDVMVYDTSSGVFPRVITAKSAIVKGDKWSLLNGSVHNYDAAGNLSYGVAFSSLEINVAENVFNFSEQKTPEEMNAGELKSAIDSFSKSGFSTSALRTDYFMKFAVPLATFIFALLAIPLSATSTRAGKSWGFVLAVIVVFSYYVFASVFRSMGRGGLIIPEMAAYFPPLCIALLGTGLFLREGLR